MRIGRDLRTGAGSEDGKEVVIGTALMRIGENSRTVAAAVNARLDEIRRALPPGIEIRTSSTAPASWRPRCGRSAGTSPRGRGS